MLLGRRAQDCQTVLMILRHYLMANTLLTNMTIPVLYIDDNHAVPVFTYKLDHQSLIILQFEGITFGLSLFILQFERITFASCL